MRTNIVLDDELVIRALQLTGVKTKRELVNLALHELVNLKKKNEKRPLSGAFDELRELGEGQQIFSALDRRNRPNPFPESD